jgi:hypothetical protein
LKSQEIQLCALILMMSNSRLAHTMRSAQIKQPFRLILIKSAGVFSMYPKRRFFITFFGILSGSKKPERLRAMRVLYMVEHSGIVPLIPQCQRPFAGFSNVRECR